MPKKTDSIVPSPRKKSLGDRIRGVADQLKQETDIQIQATSRILGAAAQIAENHDQLIDEVVEMVEQDLTQQKQTQLQSQPYTPATLQQQFKTLKQAKQHFGVKAGGWAALADKLNEAPVTQPTHQPSNLVGQRLDVIEQEIQVLRAEVTQILAIVTEILAVARQ